MLSVTRGLMSRGWGWRSCALRVIQSQNVANGLQRRWSSFVFREDLRLSTNAPCHTEVQSGLPLEITGIGVSPVVEVVDDTFPVINPATGEEITRVPDMSVGETQVAIDNAYDALEGWSNTPAKERAAALHRWYLAVMDEQEYLAQLMTAEMGKPLAEARGEIAYGASFLLWFSEEAKRIEGDVLPAASSSQRIMVTRQPVGVCSLITPWNFPNAMITRKAGAALAAGCTAIIKPSEDTPLSAEALVKLAYAAGIPKHVLQVVTCSRDSVEEVGKELATNEKVRKISFTGSTVVGKYLTTLAADTMKRVSMELGGNAPFIVFDDADLDAAVVGAMASKFRASGQTCVCANRFFVHDTVFDAFVDKLEKAVSMLVVGNGVECGVTQGPLINVSAVKKVEAMVHDAVEQGATIITGGKRPECGEGYYEPTILVDVNDDMKIVKNEIFGPVAVVMRFSSDEEVVRRANSTNAGLAAYFYTKNIGRVWKISEKLEYGMVGVNSGIVSTENAPFGGIKESGLGREGSKYGLAEYLETKYVMLSLV
eukprot:m.185369 g.185369  ORF g.185369 m.185369 type:complete len:540 (+) comp32232_c0_seq3:140-1759(+)